MSNTEKVHLRQPASIDPQRIREEIASLESRLNEIGYDGDCAYERAMIRFFEQQVAMRRTWLEAN